MATSAGAFFAGIGTTFVILAVGFGGGLLTARSALNEPSGLQHRSSGEAPTPVRVVLPSSAEAAQPSPQLAQQQTSDQQTEMPLPPEPAKQVQPVEKQVEDAAIRKTDAEDRDRKRRYAERKARRAAEARARRDQQRAPQQEAPVMAFGGDNSSRFGGWSGN